MHPLFEYTVWHIDPLHNTSNTEWINCSTHTHTRDLNHRTILPFEQRDKHQECCPESPTLHPLIIPATVTDNLSLLRSDIWTYINNNIAIKILSHGRYQLVSTAGYRAGSQGPTKTNELIHIIHPFNLLPWFMWQPITKQCLLFVAAQHNVSELYTVQ